MAGRRWTQWSCLTLSASSSTGQLSLQTGPLSHLAGDDDVAGPELFGGVAESSTVRAAQPGAAVAARSGLQPDRVGAMATGLRGAVSGGMPGGVVVGGQC